jgi:hypothetical protein
LGDEREVIYAVIIDLPTDPFPGRATVKAFREACWSMDVEPEHIDVTESNLRAHGVRTVPTIRVFDDADPYGEPIAEHVGMADADTIRELLKKGQELAA